MKNWVFVKIIIFAFALLSALYLSIELIRDNNDFSISIGLTILVLFGLLTINFIKYIAKEYHNN